MRDMFCHCESLEALNISSFDTSNVKSMEYMFEGCSSLETLDLSKFNTSKVRSLMYIFKECHSLKEVKLPEDAHTRERIIDQLQINNIHCKML